MACFHAVAEGEAAGDLEGHFAGVYVVVAAVEDRGLEVDDGVAGEVAADGGFEDAFFDGGNELRGMAPPKMSFTNWKPVPRGRGSMRILQSPNWPWPPLCFLWRPWPWRRRGWSRGRGLWGLLR